MASLNKVLLIGNLTRPPELRYTPSGTAVADLRLAVNRNYTTQSGEKREEACFLTVIVWGKQAESCGEYLDKGSQVFVEGRLQTRDWEGKDGQKRTATEVVAERVQFMSRTKGGGAGNMGAAMVGGLASLPQVDDCSRTASSAPGRGGWLAPEWVAGLDRIQWLVCVGITGWFASEYAASFRECPLGALRRQLQHPADVLGA